MDTLDNEVTLFSDRLVRNSAHTIIGGIPLIYLNQNISTLANLMGYPKLFLKILHGCYYGKSRDFDYVGSKYGHLLESAAVDELRTDIGIIQNEEAEKFLSQLNQSKTRLIENSKNWRLGMLDNYRLPHPLLGKITVRETLYVTILEVQYRRKLLE